MAVSPQPPKPPAPMEPRQEADVLKFLDTPLPTPEFVALPEPDRWMALGPLYPLKWLVFGK